MSDHDAALKALAEAQAALAALETAEKAGTPPVDDEHVAPGSSLFSDPTKLKPAPAKFVDLGPTYLGVVAVNGG